MQLTTKLFASAAVIFAAGNLFAVPIPYVSGTYSQNFDGLATTGNGTIASRGPNDIQGTPGGGTATNSGVTGWTMSNPVDLSASSANATEFRAQDGSLSGSSGRGVVSFGTTGSTDRALGTLATSNQINRFGVAFTNNSGATIPGFSLTFTGEQWRRGDVATGNVMPFDYAITSNAADNIDTAGIFTNIGSFSSPNSQTTTNVALDGNLPANQVQVSVAVNSIAWTNGATLMIRWNGQDLSGQDNGLSIDNLSLNAVPEPMSCLLALVAVLGAACIRRR